MMHAGFKLTDCCGRHSIDCNCNEESYHEYDSDDLEDDEAERAEEFKAEEDEAYKRHTEQIDRNEFYYGEDR